MFFNYSHPIFDLHRANNYDEFSLTGLISNRIAGLSRNTDTAQANITIRTFKRHNTQLLFIDQPQSVMTVHV